MNVKKTLIVLLCVILCVVFVACDGVYTPGNTPSGTGGNTDNNGGDTGDDDISDDDLEEGVFSVKLITNEGQSLGPNPNLTKINAIWTNLSSNNGAYVSAAFDSMGRARVSGLDGDYAVTISSLPDGYAYNPNIYTATNDEPHLEIVLYELKTIADTECSGSNWGTDVCVIDGSGAYCAVLTAANFESGVRFRFEPRMQGEYSITSMIDVTSNKINPYLDFHYGNAGGFVNSTPATVQDGGGEENTYTKNFRFTITLEAKKVGNPYYFRIYATSLDKNVFPVKVYFILERDGEVTTVNKYKSDAVQPAHDFAASADVAFSDVSGTMQFFAYYKDGYEIDNNGLLDGKIVKLNPADGFYWIYDYERNDRGEAVYDSSGNLNLTEPLHRLYASLNYNQVSDQGFTGDDVKLGWIEGKNDTNQTVYYNYKSFVEAYKEASMKGVTNFDGNIEGSNIYPVTEELKLFMQRFSITNRYFNDGSGFGEFTVDNNGNSIPLYKSTESNQWLFACGYFD